jgi:hypothetical protein
LGVALALSAADMIHKQVRPPALFYFFLYFYFYTEEEVFTWLMHDLLFTPSTREVH